MQSPTPTTETKTKQRSVQLHPSSTGSLARLHDVFQPVSRIGTMNAIAPMTRRESNLNAIKPGPQNKNYAKSYTSKEFIRKNSHDTLRDEECQHLMYKNYKNVAGALFQSVKSTRLMQDLQEYIDNEDQHKQNYFLESSHELNDYIKLVEFGETSMEEVIVRDTPTVEPFDKKKKVKNTLRIIQNHLLYEMTDGPLKLFNEQDPSHENCIQLLKYSIGRGEDQQGPVFTLDTITGQRILKDNSTDFINVNNVKEQLDDLSVLWLSGWARYESGCVPYTNDDGSRNVNVYFTNTTCGLSDGNMVITRKGGESLHLVNQISDKLFNHTISTMMQLGENMVTNETLKWSTFETEVYKNIKIIGLDAEKSTDIAVGGDIVPSIEITALQKEDLKAWRPRFFADDIEVEKIQKLTIQASVALTKYFFFMLQKEHRSYDYISEHMKILQNKLTDVIWLIATLGSQHHDDKDLFQRHYKSYNTISHKEEINAIHRIFIQQFNMLINLWVDKHIEADTTEIDIQQWKNFYLLGTTTTNDDADQKLLLESVDETEPNIPQYANETGVVCVVPHFENNSGVYPQHNYLYVTFTPRVYSHYWHKTRNTSDLAANGSYWWDAPSNTSDMSATDSIWRRAYTDPRSRDNLERGTHTVADNQGFKDGRQELFNANLHPGIAQEPFSNLITKLCSWLESSRKSVNEGLSMIVMIIVGSMCILFVLKWTFKSTISYLTKKISKLITNGNYNSNIKQFLQVMQDRTRLSKIRDTLLKQQSATVNLLNSTKPQTRDEVISMLFKDGKKWMQQLNPDIFQTALLNFENSTPEQYVQQFDSVTADLVRDAIKMRSAGADKAPASPQSELEINLEKEVTSNPEIRKSDDEQLFRAKKSTQENAQTEPRPATQSMPAQLSTGQISESLPSTNAEITQDEDRDQRILQLIRARKAAQKITQPDLEPATQSMPAQLSTGQISESLPSTNAEITRDEDRDQSILQLIRARKAAQKNTQPDSEPATQSMPVPPLAGQISESLPSTNAEITRDEDRDQSILQLIRARKAAQKNTQPDLEPATQVIPVKGHITQHV